VWIFVLGTVTVYNMVKLMMGGRGVKLTVSDASVCDAKKSRGIVL
jgi:hypothetical protein